jgi:predicted nucleic acid-binding protein
MLVLDASIALSWCFKDEAAPATDALVVRARRDGAAVPSHWTLEVMNALLVAERRGRIAAREASAHVRTLEDLGVEVDAETDRRAGREIFALARAERLTIYDAAYLELAMRRGAVIATLDVDLAKAAKRVGVPLAL